MMEKGDIVTIYDDPLTESNPEGKAELITRLNTDGFNQEYWSVRFIEDGYKTARWIKK